MKKLYLLLLFIVSTIGAFAQSDTTRMLQIRNKLDLLVKTDSTYLRETDVSVGSIPLNEMLRNVARINSVNLSVQVDNTMMVTCNFTRAKIVDLIYFLCSEYKLTLDVIGNIVSIRPFIAPPALPKPPIVEFNRHDTTLSYDVLNHKLIDVAKMISTLTRKNIVVPQSLYTRQISGYVNSMPVEEAIYTLASTNDLTVENSGAGIWNFSVAQQNANQGKNNSTPQQYVRRRQFDANQFSVDSLGRVTANITRGNVYDIILDLCEQLNYSYYFITPVNQQTSVFVRDVDPETLLNVMFAGTQYSYYRENDIYMFGSTGKDAGLTSTRIYKMRYRTVNKVIEQIPQALKSGAHVQMFPDLNSVIISGDQRQVARIAQFLKEIDVNVPMVTIEVMIVDATKSVIQEAGITAGVGGEPVKRNGQVSPGVKMNLGAASINHLINSLNGWGSINLGKVPTDFYVNLKMLEENGTIELRSTPKLSTLNGHEATLKSGETKYYKEVNNNIIGTQNPIQSESYVWKSVEANLSIKITPFISEDKTITLDIDIEQTEFLAREEKNAPPGTSSRNFKSIIRVQNEDMVLLGGIERNSREKSTSGLPLIARIPILKWIFGVTKDNKVTHKLNVFIKPTVI